MKRRQALQTISLSPLAFAMNCSKNSTGPSDEEFIPDTTHPYYDPGIETDSDFTSDGCTTLTTSSDSLDIIVLNENDQLLDTIWVNMLTSPQQTIITARDPYQNYLPAIKFFSGTAKPIFWEETLRLYESAKNKIRDIAVKYLPESITNISDSFEDPNNLPFVVYQGQKSFNDFKNDVSLASKILGDESPLLAFSKDEEIKKGLGIISLITGPTPSNIVNLIDVILETIELNTSLKIDRNQKYDWYNIPGLDIPFFLPRTEKEPIFDIKYYFPTAPDNKWIFRQGWNTATANCLGTKRIKGKDLIIFESFGNREYYGFNYDELRYYGFYTDELGDVLFNPSLLIGDSSIVLGKSYTTDSNIIIEKYPEITGSFTETIKYERLEDAIVSAGSFGSCLKAKEIVDLYMKNKNTGESASEIIIGYHWFAKNIGKVKTEILGEYSSSSFELSSANVNNMSVPKIAQQSSSKMDLHSLALPYLIKKILR